MNPNGKHVVQLDQSGKFIADHPSIAAAARAVGASETLVFNCCHNHKGTRTVKGHIFVLWENYNPFHDYSFTFNSNRKQVAMCKEDGTELARYPSIVAAAQQFNNTVARYKIGKCCNGKAKTYAGYRWKFV